MNEVIVWFQERHSPEGNGGSQEQVQRKEEQERIRQALLGAGLQMTRSEEPEDLRSLFTGGEPALLLAELNAIRTWAGWEIVAELREQGIELPVFVISDAAPGEGTVEAFKAGANDYLMSPVYTEELLWRIMNLLMLSGRRRRMSHLLRIDGLVLDPGRRHVNRDGREVKLTGKEFDLLYYLAVHAGQICPRTEILRQVWGYHFDADTNVVDVYIRHLRLKVDKGCRVKLIHTVRGSGYVLRASPGDATC